MKHFVLRILGATLIIFGITWLMLMLHLNILCVALLFIIPIAGLLFGYILGTYAFKGFKKDGLEYKSEYGIALIIYSCLLLFALTYFDYASCYVIDDFSLNHFFIGEHISNYALGDKTITFGDYFKIRYIDPTISVSVKGNRNNPLETGISVIIIYILNYLVIGIVSFKYFSRIDDCPMCKTCGYYYNDTEIDRFSNDKNEIIIDNEIMDYIESGKVYLPQNLKKKDYSYSVRLAYCPKCNDGILTIISHQYTGRKYSNEIVNSHPVTSIQSALLRGKMVDFKSDEKKHKNVNQPQEEKHIINNIQGAPITKENVNGKVMYCIYCGTKLPSDARFCKKCGKPC